MSSHIGPVTDDIELELCQGWFRVLLEKEFGKRGGISQDALRYEVDLGDLGKCAITLDAQSRILTVVSANEIASSARAIARDAFSRARSRADGPLEAWRIGFKSTANLGDESARHHMLRSLGEHKRFAGYWKLGPNTLLSFGHNASDTAPFFANQEVAVTFRVHGPSRGMFSPPVQARRHASLVRALVCLATAARLDAPGQLMGAKPQFEEELRAQLNEGTPELPGFYDSKANPVELWPLIERLDPDGNTETGRRLGGALLAYDHALSQKTPAASTMLFVASLEALSVPNAPWKLDRVSKRFAEFLTELCPAELAETIAHPNSEQVFGRLSSSKKLANALYNLRSQSIHAGNLGTIVDAFGIDVQSSMETALVGRLSHDAILRFMEGPFSSLCGHPEIDPSLRLELSQNERLDLISRAKSNGLTLAQLARRALGF